MYIRKQSKTTNNDATLLSRGKSLQVSPLSWLLTQRPLTHALKARRKCEVSVNERFGSKQTWPRKVKDDLPSSSNDPPHAAYLPQWAKLDVKTGVRFTDHLRVRLYRQFSEAVSRSDIALFATRSYKHTKWSMIGVR